MRNLSWCALLLPLLGALHACSPPASAPVEKNGRAMLQQAAIEAERRAIPKSDTDWQSWAADLEPTIPEDAPMSAAHGAIQELVKRYADPHARFMPAVAPAPPSNSAGAPAAAAADARAAAPAPQHPPIPTLPEGQMLAHNVAYLVLPQCPGFDPAAGRSYARALRSTIRRLANENPTGWIVDLRLNGGGDIWPMLVGMWPLLGDGTCASAIGTQSAPRWLACNSTQAWMDDRGEKSVRFQFEEGATDSALPAQKCAVLIGSWTMSSGELLAGALGSLPTSRLFGEPTAGLTTGTDSIALMDGSRLIVPVDMMGDRHGAPLGPHVIPAQPVNSSAWPTHDDAVARAASDWITAPQQP